MTSTLPRTSAARPRFAGRVAGACLLALAGLSAAHAVPLTATVVDQKGRPLADAVVYAVPAAGRAPALPAGARAIIDQIDREFVPLVSVMQAGTAVVFPNKDDVEHDVYSFSAAKRFEIRLYSGVPAKPVVFDKPGLVTLGCNIHDSMVAHVIVVDTPYFAKTDKAGRVALEVPAGNYNLAAWHYTMRTPEVRPVQPAQAGGSALKFTLTTETN